jgi:hypothetical protein
MAFIDLLTSLNTFQDLHELADGKSGKVKVEKDQLRHLLIDHSFMLQELKRHGVTCRDPTVKKRRETITEE